MELKYRATRTGALPWQPRTAPHKAPWTATLLGLLLLFAGTAQSAVEPWPGTRPDYPLPPAEPALLFFLQRSMNPNTVVYTARLDGDGRLDDSTPVEAFWLRFHNDGERRDLSFVERLLAYGVNSEPHPEIDGAYVAEIVGFDTRPFVVDLDGDGSPRATITINGRPARLASIYLELDESSSWPKVDAIVLRGTDRDSGARVLERFVP